MHDDPVASTVLLVAVLLASGWLALAIHECGHALAGATQGFVFGFLVIGPLRVERSPAGRYRVRLNREILAWGGRSRSFPDDSENLIRRSSIFVAAGPVTSALVASIAWILELHLGPGLAKVFLSGLAVTSFAVFLGTAQPFGSGLSVSDGGAVWRMARGGVLAARFAALQALGSATSAGVRPRELSARALDQALVPSDDSPLELVALAMAARHAADRGEHARAAALAVRAWAAGENHPRAFGAIALPLALVAALGADAARARQAFARVDGTLVSDHARLWAEAEIAALDGLFDEARVKARAGIAALDRARFGAPSALDRERLQFLAEITEGRTTGVARPRA